MDEVRKLKAALVARIQKAQQAAGKVRGGQPSDPVLHQQHDAACRAMWCAVQLCEQHLLDKGPKADVAELREQIRKTVQSAFAMKQPTLASQAQLQQKQQQLANKQQRIPHQARQIGRVKQQNKSHFTRQRDAAHQTGSSAAPAAAAAQTASMRQHHPPAGQLVAGTLRSSVPRRSYTLAADVAADTPSILLPVKANLVDNDFTRLVRQQASEAEKEAREKLAAAAAQRAATLALLESQLEEARARRAAEAEQRAREARDMNAAVERTRAEQEEEHRADVARKAELRAKLTHQAQEAAAQHRAQAEAAAREAALDRAELEAEMAADRAASERKAAGERVRLAAFMAAQEAAAAAKRAAEAARLEAEQKFNKECIEAMDEAQRRRDAAVDARRKQQHERFLAAGGQQLECQGREGRLAEERALLEALEREEARQAEAARRRREEERGRAQEVARGVMEQIAAKDTIRKQEAEAKAAERAAATTARAAAEAEKKRAKAAARAEKAALFAAQREEVAKFKARKLVELNAPLAEADRWVHAPVVEGRQRGFMP